MYRPLILALCAVCLCATSVAAQTLQDILQLHQEEVAKPSRNSVGVVLDDLVASGLPEVATFLERWQAREVWMRSADGLFFYVEELEDDTLRLIDISTLDETAIVPEDDAEQIRPNGGVRREIGTALVQFQLSDPDPDRRLVALEAIARDMSAELIAPLLASIETETDPDILARKETLAGLLLAEFGEETDARVAAIEGLAGSIAVETRGVLNRILDTDRAVAARLPEDANIAAVLEVGQDITAAEAYDLLVEAGLAPPRIGEDAVRQALAAHIDAGAVGGVPLARLDDPDQRITAYNALAADGVVPAFVTEAEVAAAIAAHVVFDVYSDPDTAVTEAAEQTLGDIERQLTVYQAADLGLDALSLASIYFLAAIGLAITFGVMGVINMAHGEFIMMGAYTGYVVQNVLGQISQSANYTLSLIIALPLAFAVTFGAGVLMERSVIRWLYHRPLETLLATFGISIALQQLAKNIFGTQARPLTSPGWLSGAWEINDVVQISSIRIAIFILAVIFLVLLIFILRRTRLGLEVRAVTQNRRMAAAMGINPDRINMLTFGLGSGIAGIAGVAIGLNAQVTSEMGQNYIVQSFMTVVVGGVGNVWGTLLGAGLIGFLQKGIEWLNPSNTLAAQTYMVLFIILFIQFRPRGLIALRGRAAGD